MEWQPIKTAPKDGQMIIAHNAIIGGTYVVGWHKGNLPLDLEDVPHWSDCPNQNAADALWFNHLYFTHWMPLPPLPSNAELCGGPSGPSERAPG